MEFGGQTDEQSSPHGGPILLVQEAVGTYFFFRLRWGSIRLVSSTSLLERLTGIVNCFANTAYVVFSMKQISAPGGPISTKQEAVGTYIVF